MDSFRRLIRGIRDFRSILWFIGIVFGGLLFVKNASAQGVAVFPIGIEPVGFNAAGDLMARATYEARLAHSSQSVANSLYYQRSIGFNKATMAKAFKIRKLIGPALLLDGIVSAAGWGINEINGQVTADTTPTYTKLPPGVTGWCVAGLACGYPSVYDAFEAHRNLDNPPSSLTGWFVVQSGAWVSGATAVGAGQPYSDGYYCVQFYQNAASHPSGMGSGWSSCSIIVPMMASGAAPIVSDPHAFQLPVSATVTDEQIHQAIKNNPDAWKQILTYPPYPQNIVGTEAGTNFANKPIVHDPMPAQMQAIQAQYRTDTGQALAAGTSEAAVPQAMPAPTTAPYTGTTALPATGTATAPATAVASASVTFPVFCTWASSVCAALDWLTDDVAEVPADVAVPEVEVPIVAQTFDSGLGAGSCPGAIAVEFEFNGTHNIGFSYQPMCDFAAMIKPLILLLGAIASAWIISGKGMKSA